VAVSGKTVGITGGNAAVNLQLSDVTANLALADTKVEALSSKVTVNGTLTDGELVVKQSDSAKGNLELQDSKLTVIIDSEPKDLVLTTKQVNDIADNGVVDLGAMTGDVEVSIETADGKVSGTYAKYYSDFVLEDGKVVALGRNTSYYTDKAGDTVSANAAAGLALADAALVELNPQARAPKGGLATVLNLLDKANAETADELGASLAGASTAVLGMAAQGDVDRQLQAIRNRTTMMGVDQSVANEEMPYFNAWINAEGDMSELSESGTESGYKLTSWGGTVGFDVDFCPTFTAGMALTAMYGDLDAEGADKATGNLDTQYLSIFARYAPSAWTHTFVGTIGKADISLDRTVAGVQTQGETDGLSFGLMYEVGRVLALNEDGTTCLQPVFNVTWKHTAVDGYTEKGSDLALEVGDQTVDTVTFGMGARLQTVVGESLYNRASILEARVLAKLDAGDRQGSSDVALTALPDSGTSVDSAERGAFGLEVGAGLTIPVGQEGGSIFADAAVELRRDYTNVNGTVGYRVNF
jgi:outer membrane autotransporter protein